ncbi:hypothetical protein BDR26DRAFT_215993 [Obelidium mucronatum]|nr:hypothetical protein BDR26DRAFT_215993 [Obelidium mucronatum]
MDQSEHRTMGTQPASTLSQLREWRRDRHHQIRVKSGVTEGRAHLFYCIGNAGLTMIDDLFAYFLLDALISAGLDGRAAGTILLVSEIFNVFVGPLSSLLMSNVPFRSFGQHRAWLLITSIPLVLFFELLWVQPTLPSLIQPFYYGPILLLFNWFYGHCLCTFEAIMPLMNSSPILLQKVNASRLFIGSIAGLIVVSIPSTLVYPIPDQSVRFLIMASFAGFVLLAGILLWVFSVTESKHQHLKAPDSFPDLKAKLAGNTSKSWIKSCKQLFSSKRFITLLINTFLLWSIIIFTSSSLPSLSRILFPLPNDPEGTSLKSTFVIIVSKLGISISQIVMAVFPYQFTPERSVKMSFVLLLGSTALIGVVSTATTTSTSISSATLIAAVPTILPEIHVVEEEPEDWENVVYAWVDSIRELSLAVSFFLAGFLLDDETAMVNQIWLCGWIPFGIACVVACVHLYFPNIVFDSVTEV